MKPPARILILTSGSLGRNPRPAKEAAALAKAGYQVTVLHPSEGSHYDQIDDTLAAEGGYRNELVTLASTSLAGLARRIRGRLARQAVPLGIEDVAALGAGRALLAQARSRPADLTIVHNEISLWAGRELLREGRRVAADIEDWYSEDLPERDRRHRPRRLLRELEGAALREAAFVTTTSEALSAALLARHGGRAPAVVTNSFPLQSDPRTARPAADGTPAFFWFSQTIGPGRGLERFLEIWTRLACPVRLVLLGEPWAGFADHLNSLLPPDRRPLLEFRGLVPPNRLATEIARHDIGLALEDGSIPSRDCTITNKILQYLNAGLAVVATPTAGQREVFGHAPGAGLLLDFADVPAATSALDTWLAEPERIRSAQRAARAAAEKIYCWEVEAPKLVEQVRRALGKT